MLRFVAQYSAIPTVQVSFQHFVLYSLAVPCEAICNELKTLASFLFCNGAIEGHSTLELEGF